MATDRPHAIVAGLNAPSGTNDRVSRTFVQPRARVGPNYNYSPRNRPRSKQAKANGGLPAGRATPTALSCRGWRRPSSFLLTFRQKIRWPKLAFEEWATESRFPVSDDFILFSFCCLMGFGENNCDIYFGENKTSVYRPAFHTDTIPANEICARH